MSSKEDAGPPTSPDRQGATHECDVLVVGSGPVGLALAIDLAKRGVCTVIADSKLAPLKLPKMERSNPRSMEIFRRLGVADRIREKGYPGDLPMDCYIVRSLLETPPIVHLAYASVNEARDLIAKSTDGRLPREPYQLISQYTLEPILIEAVRSLKKATFLTGRTLVSFVENVEGIEATFVTTDGAIETVLARYLAGCDGGVSTVRKQLGIQLVGKGALATVRQVFFRSSDFWEHCKLGHARHYSFAGKSHGGAASGGVIVVQDDLKHFTLQTAAPDGTDWVHEVQETVGAAIEVEILYVGEWKQNMLMANRFSSGRAFLAGDSNHLFIPAGGLGMNTGIVDANNLGWKLAGLVQSWGGPALAASYDAERRPTCERVLRAVNYAVQGVLEWRGLAANIDLEGSPADSAVLAEFAQLAEPLNRRVYEMHGTELGYRYSSSIICTETGAPPPDEIRVYEPSTFPGCILPHVWLPDGTALYDRLGTGFVLINLGGDTADCRAIESAMAKHGAPFEIISITSPQIRKLYERDLLIVRPDLHVCWRGDRLPDNCTSLAAVITGNA